MGIGNDFQEGIDGEGLISISDSGAEDPEGVRNVDAFFCCLRCGAGLSDDCPKHMDDDSLSEDIWHAFSFLLH